MNSDIGAASDFTSQTPNIATPLKFVYYINLAFWIVAILGVSRDQSGLIFISHMIFCVLIL
jgi:hypothetical protein